MALVTTSDKSQNYKLNSKQKLTQGVNTYILIKETGPQSFINKIAPIAV